MSSAAWHEQAKRADVVWDSDLAVSDVEGHAGGLRLVIEDYEEQLCSAASLGVTVIVRRLLEEGVNPNAKDSGGQSALFYATTAGRVEIVGLLLEKGAEPNPKDTEGMTPLLLAASNISISQRWPAMIEVARLLLKYRANPNARDGEGMTPLIWAAGPRFHAAEIG